MRVWHTPKLGLRKQASRENEARLATASVRRTALVRNPDTRRRVAGGEKDVDWDTAAWVPVAADAEPFGIKLFDEALRNGDGAGLVEVAVVPKAGEVELQRLGLDEPLVRHIVDDEMRKVRLACHRANGGEFWARETREILGTFVRIGHAFQRRIQRGLRRFGSRTQLRKARV